QEVVGVLRIQRAVGIRQRLDADAECQDVRLGGEVDPRRTARAEAREHIVAALRRALVALRSDGQYPRRVAGTGDAAPLKLAFLVGANVAGCGDDDDAGINRALR